MGFYQANYEFVKMKEVFKGDPEWEKAFVLFHCLCLRDRATAEHSIEVGYYAAKIAEKLNLEPCRYFLAGILHDIGKINMNDNPLKSSNVLSRMERSDLKDHVLHGVLTLSELGFGKDIIEFCIRHHERLNGSGYPLGVNKKSISIIGRIAQVSDIFSALTSSRSYREHVYTHDEALMLIKKEIQDTKGLDSNIVSILEEIVIKEEIKKTNHYA